MVHRSPVPYSAQRIGDTLQATFRVSVAVPIVLAIVILPLFWAIAASYSVECVRQTDGTVRAKVQAMRIGWSSKPETVENLRTARVETVTGTASFRETDDGSGFGSRRRRRSSSGPTHRVLLVDGSGVEHPVSGARSSGRSKYDTLAQAINRFLANPSQRRTVARQPWDPLTLPILLVPVLGLLYYLTGRCDCVIDRSSGTVVVKKWGPLGARTTVVPLEEVQEFSIVTRPARWNRRAAQHAALVRTNGSVIQLGQDRTTDADESDISNTINALERFRAESVGA